MLLNGTHQLLTYTDDKETGLEVNADKKCWVSCTGYRRHKNIFIESLKMVFSCESIDQDKLLANFYSVTRHSNTTNCKKSLCSRTDNKYIKSLI